MLEEIERGIAQLEPGPERVERQLLFRPLPAPERKSTPLFEASYDLTRFGEFGGAVGTPLPYLL